MTHQRCKRNFTEKSAHRLQGGKPKRVCAGVSQMIVTRVGSQEEKPVAARDRLGRLLDDVPRIELCARQQARGWVVWGNELESSFNLAAKNPQNGG
jgi:N6-adenosine-specific RNA methylase IME4